MSKSISAIAVTILTLLASPSAAQTASTDTPAVASTVTVPIRAMGSENAPVTIDFFGSFVCLDCAQWHLDVLPQIKAKFVDTGQVRVLFHDAMTTPVMASARAGMYGLCASPDSFFLVADAFMKGLISIKAGGDESTFYSDAAAVSGRDPEEFEQCTNDEATYNILIAENADSRLSNFQKMPGIMINGAAITDTSFENISAEIFDKFDDN